MPNVAVIGSQWGDEGKGKIVDLLCERFDVVARYQGGHNAGHTVKFADQHFALRLIPSGILHPGKLCLLGNGMVIDPEALLEEIKNVVIDKIKNLPEEDNDFMVVQQDIRDAVGKFLQKKMQRRPMILPILLDL